MLALRARLLWLPGLIANALGHILGTIAGRTFAEVRFPRPMPGFYSYPLLLLASLWLFLSLWRTRESSRA